MNVDERDHRLDLLELAVNDLRKANAALQATVDDLREHTTNLESRTLIQRAITPLERKLLDAQLERSLAGSVNRYYIEKSNKSRRVAIAWVVAVMAGLAATADFIRKLIPKFP